MSEPSHDVQRASEAFDEGDWRRAGSLLDKIDDSTLDGDPVDRARQMRAVLQPDPAATVVAAALGILLLTIAALLYA